MTNFHLKYKGKKLTKPEARVLVAKDVIKWLNNKELKVNTNYYIYNTKHIGSKGTVKQNLGKLKKCGVCALGACFLAGIDKFNKLDMITFTSNEEKVLKDYLRNIFSPHQMTLIECAFERSSIFRDRFDKVSNLTHVYQATQMFANIDNVNTRLRLIMANIIKNNGRFRLTKPVNYNEN